MSLKEQIEGDIKKAMLAKNKDDLRALRAIKSMILLAQTEKGAGENLSEDAELKILQKAAKQRNDSMALYREQNRDDLANAEQVELEVIKRYLPEQLSVGSRQRGSSSLPPNSYNRPRNSHANCIALTKENHSTKAWSDSFLRCLLWLWSGRPKG